MKEKRNDLFYWKDEDTIIGFAYAIRDDVWNWYADDEEEQFMKDDLFQKLKGLHNEIVKCWYHPMGSWYVEVL